MVEITEGAINHNAYDDDGDDGNDDDGGNNDIKNDQVAYHLLKCGFPIHFHVHFPTCLMVSEGRHQ